MDEDAFAQATFMRLAAVAEPILQRKLAHLGVSSLEGLERDQASSLFRESLLEAATLSMPTVDIGLLRRALLAMTNEKFIRALSVCRTGMNENGGAFDPAKGIDAAILLAGFGLPVCPLDKKTMKPLAKPSDSIDVIHEIFSAAKTAIVGYSAAEAPFHLLVTDCANTLKSLIEQNAAFSGIKAIMQRDGRGIPSVNTVPFKHACLLVAKQPEDRIASYAHDDSNPNRGSALILSGWVECGEAVGIENDGMCFVPNKLLEEIIRDPKLATWLHKPSSTAYSIMN